MKRVIGVLCGLLAAALLIELLFFNFRALESRTFGPAVPSEASIAAGETSFTVFDGPEAMDIQSIRLPLSKTGSSDWVAVRLFVTDEGSSVGYELPELQISPAVPSSQFIRLNLHGKARSITVNIQGAKPDDVYELGDVLLNARRPFAFSLLRVFGVFAGLGLLWLLRPSSVLHRTRALEAGLWQQALLVLIVAVQLLVTAMACSATPSYVTPPWRHHRQYHKMAVSLTEGRLDLGDEPSASLLAMENPYDYHARVRDHVDYWWDEAYYQGKYYCYFGILPVLLFYLPYYLVTGNAFPTWLGVLICLTALTLALVWLLYETVRWYFPRCSTGDFLLLEVTMFLGGTVLIGAQCPTFYYLPISLALALTAAALACWVRAGRDGYRRGWIVAGGVLMALTAASRPQFVLASFLVFPLLGRETIERWKAGGKDRTRAVTSVLLALIPYVIVAGALMWYNASRFGSPFDFGANYQMTTNDVTHRGFHPDRLPFGLFSYLLQPVSLIGRSPFLRSVPVQTSYQGFTIYETMYGGLLWFSPALAAPVLLLGRRVRAGLKEKKLLGAAAVCAVLGVLVACLDVEAGGILQRYWMDFGFLLSLPAVWIVLTRLEEAERLGEAVAAERRMRLLGLTVWSVLIWTLWLARML